MKDLMKVALDELREEDDRSRIDALKEQLREQRKGWLYRLWFNLRYKKPTIKWEYR